MSQTRRWRYIPRREGVGQRGLCGDSGLLSAGAVKREGRRERQGGGEGEKRRKAKTKILQSTALKQKQMAPPSFVPAGCEASVEYRMRAGIAKAPNHKAIFEDRRVAVAVVNVRPSPPWPTARSPENTNIAHLCASHMHAAGRPSVVRQTDDDHVSTTHGT